MKKLLIPLALILSLPISAQDKKVLDHDDFHRWRSIENEMISNDGSSIAYVLKSNGEENSILKLSDASGTESLSYVRGDKPAFTFDSDYLVFTIKPDMWEERELRRKKTEKEDLPGDSLAIFQITEQSIMKYPGLKSVKVPEKWGDWIAYLYEPPKDTSNKKSKKDKEAFPLVILQLSTGESFEYPGVTDFALSEKGASVGFVSKGDSAFAQGVYVFDASSKTLQPAFRAKGAYKSLVFDEDGNQLAFISDLDTTKALIKKWTLHSWQKGVDSSRALMTPTNELLGDQWLVSEHYKNLFSKNGKRLFFGLAPYPILQDTSLLPEEVVNVEVWSYTDSRLHTQQKIEKKEDQKKAYMAVFHLESNTPVPLAGPEIPEIRLGNEGNADVVLGLSELPYQKERSWEGSVGDDLFLIDVTSGESKRIATNVRGTKNLSPNGQYAYWYNRLDSAWFTYSVASGETRQLTTNEQVNFYDEILDTPSDPWPYGLMAWSENDEKMLVYDRFDIWELDPQKKAKPVRLTNGRPDNLRYRYVRLDREERFIQKNQKLMLDAFDYGDKHEGVYTLTYGRKGDPSLLYEGDFALGDYQKAQDGKNVIFTRQTFAQFPDLRVTDPTFKKQTQVSTANPQQAEYNWGTIELYKWTSLDGRELEGLLVKPEDFDPSKKYPLIVNFYEKSSDGLNRHRAPYPHRSTINYSFYTSRGYVIFNPDVYYREGYPGESAYNCVIPGVTKLVDEGFIDKDRIGVQGHSWGGYQIAYLVTKTDIFRCAEAGAPVPNMISAYGGIRWWTGLSRMFQYEHTQSRIGGTLWEYPIRYIENSPIFFVDKINTPLLIMHNDEDGHVPWYQGIELFVALRRLNKPSWMLNYQGEPHWPRKVQNRLDFNVRMAQFFDHYLKDAPKPVWMERGVPATEVGIRQGLELMDN